MHPAPASTLPRGCDRGGDARHRRLQRQYAEGQLGLREIETAKECFAQAQGRDAKWRQLEVRRADEPRELLTTEGYEVESAKDGLEGIELLRHDYDLIVTDINMPKVTGLQLIKGLRTNNRNIPILIITAYATEELVKYVSQFSNIALQVKPFDVDILCEKVVELLNS